MKQSPAFSSFRHWMDRWDNYLENEEKTQKINDIINGNQLILFFVKDGKVFGAPEESRVVFAKLKNPDDDIDDDWVKDANFAAFDLAKALGGEEIENIFSANDLKDIKVIEPEEVEKALQKCPEKGETPDLEKPHKKDGANTITLKDMD